MPRGTDFDERNPAPVSDNAVDPGTTQAHGAGGNIDANEPPARANRTADLPAGLKEEVNDQTLSGGGSRGNAVGSGKGGHDPRRLGEEKGIGNQQSKGGDDPTFDVKG